MSEYTPSGKWSIDNFDDATVLIDYAPGVAAQAYAGTAANARLIAVAPDLLEALKRSTHELRVAQSFYEQSGEAALAGMAAVAVQIGEEVTAQAETSVSDGAQLACED